MNGSTGEHFEAGNGFQHEQQQGGPWTFESNGQQGVFVAGDMDGSAFPEAQFQPFHQELVSGVGTQYPNDIDIDGYGDSAPYYQLPQGDQFGSQEAEHLAPFYAQDLGVLQSQELPAEGPTQLIGSHNAAPYPVPIEVDTRTPSLCSTESGESEEVRPRRSPRSPSNSDSIDSNPLSAPPTPTDKIPLPPSKTVPLQKRSQIRKETEACFCPYLQCGRGFTRKGDRDRHIKTQHDLAKKLFFCPLCEQDKSKPKHSFTRRDKVKAHHDKHHSKEPFCPREQDRPVTDYAKDQYKVATGLDCD